MVTDVKPEWRTAAASNFSSKIIHKSPAYAEEGSNTFGFNLSGELLQVEYVYIPSKFYCKISRIVFCRYFMAAFSGNRKTLFSKTLHVFRNGLKKLQTMYMNRL